jgi:superfamily II DNA or RNA helicase/intein/homing endonuclease
MEIYLLGSKGKIKGYLSSEVWKDLIDVCSYRPEDYLYSQRYLDGSWDGYIRLLKPNGTFPVGLLSNIKAVLELHGVAYEVKDIRRVRASSPIKSNLVLRDYQERVVEKAIQLGSGFIAAPTGSGKTEMSIEIIARLGLPAIFISPLEEITLQTIDRFKQALNQEIGLIGLGEFNPKLITIATWQAIWSGIKKRNQELLNTLNQFDVFFFDEADILGADKVYIVSQFLRAKHRFGLSIGSDCFILLEKDGEIIYDKIGKIFHDMPIDSVMPLNAKTIAFDGDKFLWVDCSFVHKYRNSKKCFKYHTDYGKELIVTEDHSIYRVRGSNIELVKGSDINVGDILILPESINFVNQITKINVAEKIKDFPDFYISNPPGDLIIKNAKNHREKWLWLNKGKFGSYIPLSKINSFSIFNNKNKIYTWRGNYSPAIINTKDIAYLIGLFIGNGYFRHQKRARNSHIGLAMNSKKEEKVDFYLRKLNDSGFKVSYSKVKRGKVIYFRIYCPPITKLLYQYFGDCSALTKRIPQELFQWDIESKKLIVEGLIDSDGHISKRERNRNRVRISTSSYYLAKDLELLMKTMGIQTSFHKRPPQKIRGNRWDTINQQTNYFVDFSYNIFKGKRGGHYHQLNRCSFKNILGVKVKKIEEIHEDCVYDLSIKGCENFLANGFLVHNSATPFRVDQAELKMWGATGELIQEVSTSDLIRMGYLVKPYIKFVRSEPLFIPRWWKWNKVYSQAVVSNEDRNKLLASEIDRLRSEGKIVLVLVTEIKQGKILESLTNGKFIHASSKDRRETIEDFKQNKIPILISSPIVERGWDAPNITAMVLAGAGKSQVKAIQRLGRGLRKFKEKNKVDIIDVNDQGIRYLNEHSVMRGKAYKREEEVVVYGDLPQLP